MAIEAEHIEKLLEIATAFAGGTVEITESLSRSRDVGGHDRHFATVSRLRLRVRRVDIFLSGGTLMIDGTNGCFYSIAIGQIVSFTVLGNASLQVVEHFEQHTERRTTLRRAAELAVAPDAAQQMFVGDPVG